MEITKIVESYISEFDNAFEKGNLERCNQIEKTYDSRLRRLGIDPAALHECIVNAEHMGISINEAVRNYAEGLIFSF